MPETLICLLLGFVLGNVLQIALTPFFYRKRR